MIRNVCFFGMVLLLWTCADVRVEVEEDTSFLMHTIKEPRAGDVGNTVPNMVWIHDVDEDGVNDLVTTHVSWPDKGDYVHPYVSWFRGPDFTTEYIILDKNTPGLNGNSRIYRFVLYDVDADGHKDLIGQGYYPNDNKNRWYRRPADPTKGWNEWHDYGADLENGHDIRLRDLNADGKTDLILMDSHGGGIIVKPFPIEKGIETDWPHHTLTSGDGFTHYMSFFDVNRDGLEDIVIASEEDGGNGVRWYRNPGHAVAYSQAWRMHQVAPANFTKAIARDLDNDGDIDFIGCGEGYPDKDLGWFEKTASGYVLHEIDLDNKNDVIGGHNCELVDVDGDGDEDLIVGGVDKADNKQRFRWYERSTVNVKGNSKPQWTERVFGITSAEGWGGAAHGFTCGEMTWGDVDGDGDRDFVYSGAGSGFLGWFENRSGN